MPRSESGDSFGDIVAVVDVRLPEELSTEEQELFMELRRLETVTAIPVGREGK